MRIHFNLRGICRAVVLSAALGIGHAAVADTVQPMSGMRASASHHGFDQAVSRLEQAIKDNGMGLVAQASASRAAAARGVKIPGNAVLMSRRTRTVRSASPIAHRARYSHPTRTQT